jgi:hypothetical protein
MLILLRLFDECDGAAMPKKIKGETIFGFICTNLTYYYHINLDHSPNA